MLIILAQFLVSAAVILIAGITLTRCADAIAEHTGLGRMLAGMILLATVTSLPELAVDISAVRMGMANLALGDLMGSSLFNLLILGVLDLMHQSRGRMFSHTTAAHALSGTISICLTALAGLGILLGGRSIDLSFLGVGAAAWGVLIVFVLGVRLVFYDQKTLTQEAGISLSKVAAPVHYRKLTLRRAVIGFALAAIAIVITGPFLAHSAGRLAELSGLGNTFVGTTLVALSTSLPELITSLAAVRMGAFDLAVGNIFGSNSFNMAMLVPLDAFQSGALLAQVSATHLATCLAVIFITAIAIISQLYHVERRIRFIEPDAALVVALTLGALVILYFLR